MNFIFTYVWFIKILLKSYWLTFINKICRIICPFLIKSEFLCKICPSVVEVNDGVYHIECAYTNVEDITNRFRMFCFLNDIVYLDELIKQLPKSFHNCDRLRILIHDLDSNFRQIEIDIPNRTYVGKNSKKMSQNQIIFNF